MSDKKKCKEEILFEKKGIIDDEYEVNIDIISNIDMLFLLGDTYFLDLEFNLAIKTYKRILEIDSSNERAHYLLGKSYVDINKYYPEEEKFDEAIQILESLLQRTLRDVYDYAALSLIGEAFYFKRDFDSAIKYFNDSLQVNDECFNSLYFLGRSYYITKKYSEAISVFEKLNEKHYRLWGSIESIFLLGYSYIKTKDYEKAKNSYTKYLDSFKWDIHAWINLGNVYYALSDCEEALKCYYQAWDTIVQSNVNDNSQIIFSVKEGNYKYAFLKLRKIAGLQNAIAASILLNISLVKLEISDKLERIELRKEILNNYNEMFSIFPSWKLISEFDMHSIEDIQLALYDIETKNKLDIQKILIEFEYPIKESISEIKSGVSKLETDFKQHAQDMSSDHKSASQERGVIIQKIDKLLRKPRFVTILISNLLAMSIDFGIELILYFIGNEMELPATRIALSVLPIILFAFLISYTIWEFKRL